MSGSWDNLILSWMSRPRPLCEYFLSKRFSSGKFLQQLIWKYQSVIFSVDSSEKSYIAPQLFHCFWRIFSQNGSCFGVFFWLCSFIAWYTIVLKRKISNYYQSNFLIVVSLLPLGCMWNISTFSACIHLIYFGFYWVPYQRYLNSTFLVL